MSSKPTKFKLRNKSHEIIGQYTEKELIDAIESGKYSGEEEICAANSVKWQRLASNAIFYDAFLKRVHGKEYEYENEGEEDRRAAPEKKKANENLTEAEAREHKEKTEINAKKEKGTGLTLRDSEIQSLFKSESYEKTEVQNDEFNLPSREEDEKSLPKLQMSFAERQIEKQENNTLNRDKDRRRIGMWVFAIALILLSLFNLGQNKDDTAIATKESAPQDKKSGYDLPVLPVSNEGLIQLAEFFGSSDTLPGYRQALEILNSSSSNSDITLELIKQKSFVLSEMVKLESSKEAVIKELEETITTGREKDPQASEFYRAEASIKLAEKNYSEAKKIASRAKEANPSDPENSLLLAELELESKNISDSKVLLESIESALDSSVRKKKILSRLNLELQNWKALEVAAEACVSASPAHAECYYLLAEGYAKQNQLKKARAFLDLSARLTPFATKEVSKTIFERLVHFEEILGTEEEAKKYQKFSEVLLGENRDDEKAKALKSELEAFLVNDSFLIKRGEEQQKEKRPDSAFKYYVAGVSLDPKSREALLALGLSFEKSIAGVPDYKKVETYYQRAIQKDPGFVKALVRLGAVETEQYNFDKGHNYLMHALQLDDQDAEAYYELGKHYFKRQDYVAATDAFLKAKQNNFQGDSLYYYFGLVRQKLDRSKIREGMEAFYTAYSLNPENYDALSEWLKLKIIASEKAFAIKFLKSLQANDPKNSEILRVMGEVYLANSEPRRAITFFHRSLDVNNRSSKTRMSLARALESIGELDTAAEEFHEASRIDPKNAEGFYESARILFQLQNYPKMAVVTKKLLDLSPNYPGSHKLGSLVAQSTGDKDKAISEMKKEVENNPENYSFVIEFAELYMRFNMFNEAIVELSKITNLPTENAPDKAKAAQYIKVRLTAYYLLSGCYRLLSKPELAEGSVKLGLKVDSENPLLRRELCFVYADLQRFPEATRECEYYLRRNPAAEDVDRIKQKLKDMNIDYY